jgi:hypothetical protein
VNGGKIVELIKKSAKKDMVSKIRAKCGMYTKVVQVKITNVSKSLSCSAFLLSR